MTLDELDRLVAEKILGWCASKLQGEDEWAWYFNINKPDRVFFSEWQPTRNISQAWQLLGNMVSDDIQVHLNNTGWYCQILTKNGDLGQIYDRDTAPEAITRACLLASGVEID